MKVSDVMSKKVDYVNINTPVKDVSHIIFVGGINGVPVCHNGKVVGFITEKDILAKFLPSMEEYMEDTVHARDFEGMEHRVSEILSLKAKDIMSKDPPTVTADTPLLRAQSLMSAKKVGRLPVVDEKENLVGMISRGDIFRAVVGDKLPFATDEEYHDWLSKHWDLVVRWKERLGHEVPDLTALFEEKKIKDVLDVGFGTGEHAIALAEMGFNVFGIESSSLMYKSAKDKLKHLPEDTLKRLKLIYGNTNSILKNEKNKFGAAIFMGNAFAHLADKYEIVLKDVQKALLSKKSLIVLQVINFEKVLRVNKGFLDLNFAKSKFGSSHEYAFFEFYDAPRKTGEPLTLNMLILNFDGKKWKYRSMNSTPIVYLDKERIGKLLKKEGFKKISFYGSRFWGPLFKEPFKELESDWLNVIAEK